MQRLLFPLRPASVTASAMWRKALLLLGLAVLVTAKDFCNLGEQPSAQHLQGERALSTTIDQATIWLPRTSNTSYTALGTWEYRHYQLREAIRAMLGDPTAYFMSPRMRVWALHLKDDPAVKRPETLFQESVRHKSSQGLSWWLRNVFPTLSIPPLPAKQRTPDRAICEARRRMDEWSRGTFRNKTYLEGVLLSEAQPDPDAVIWSTDYPRAAKGYAEPADWSRVVAFAPTTLALDVDLYAYQNELPGRKRLFAAPEKTWDDRNGRMAVAGYRKPEDVVGFELRHGDQKDVRVRLGFYKVVANSVPYVLVLQPTAAAPVTEGVAPGPDGKFVALQAEESFAPDNNFVPRLPKLSPQRVPAIAILYACPAGTQEWKQQTAASGHTDDTKTALAVLAEYNQGISEKDLARPGTVSEDVFRQVSAAIFTGGGKRACWIAPHEVLTAEEKAERERPDWDSGAEATFPDGIVPGFLREMRDMSHREHASFFILLFITMATLSAFGLYLLLRTRGSEILTGRSRRVYSAVAVHETPTYSRAGF